MGTLARATGLLCALSFACDGLAAAPPPQPFLTVAMSGGYWPLHEETDYGSREGLEADLAQDLARLLGMKVRFVGRKETGAGAVEAVAAGKADVAIASITPTDERRKLVDFTKPYVVLHYRLAGREGKASGALDPSGKRIAVPRGPAAAAAKALLSGAELLEVPSPESAAQAVLSGKADLAFGEDVGIVLAIQGRPLKLLGAPLGESPIAIAVPKGQTVRWDEALAKLAGRVAQTVDFYRPGEAPEPFGDVYLRFAGGVDAQIVLVRREPFEVSLEEPENAVEWKSIGVDGFDVCVRPSESARGGKVDRGVPVPGRAVVEPPAEVRRRARAHLHAKDAKWVRFDDGTFVGFGSRSVKNGQQCGYEEQGPDGKMITSSFPCTDAHYEVVVVRGDAVRATSFAVPEGT